MYGPNSPRPTAGRGMGARDGDESAARGAAHRAQGSFMPWKRAPGHMARTAPHPCREVLAIGKPFCAMYALLQYKGNAWQAHPGYESTPHPF